MIKIKGTKTVKGELSLPSDKSISHRLFMFSSIATSPSEIIVKRVGKDVETTISALKVLGVRIDREGDVYKIYPSSFSSPYIPVNMGNSGTTTRLMMGLLSSYKPHLDVVFYGDSSLSARPMKRVIAPLEEVGAKIYAREDNYLPIFIKGSDIKPIDYTLPLPSAQVKSALILASLFASDSSKIVEPIPSRDHTERFLSYMGVGIKKVGDTIFVNPGRPNGIKYKVPGDFSQAAFFITLALIIPESYLVIRDVNLNPTRTGFLDKVIEMGANVDINIKEEYPEPYGDLIVQGRQHLRYLKIEKKDIPLMIDEIPLFAILGAFSEGGVEVRGAEELRVKESDRIKAVVEEFLKMGIDIEELEDGFIVKPSHIKGGCVVNSHKDHRIAMALAILGKASEKEIMIDGEDAVGISYPDFFSDLYSIT